MDSQSGNIRERQLPLPHQKMFKLSEKENEDLAQHVYRTEQIIEQESPDASPSDRSKFFCTTPTNVSTPKFEELQVLPTPVTNSASSPTRTSIRESVMAQQPPPPSPAPQISQLHIRKWRGSGSTSTSACASRGVEYMQFQPNMKREIGHMEINPGDIHDRIVSEVALTHPYEPHRISSLPDTDKEVSPLLDAQFPLGTEIRRPEEETDKELVFTGYTLDNYDLPIRWRKVKEIGSGNFSHVVLYEALDRDKTRAELCHVAVKKLIYPENLIDENDDTLLRFENSLIRELNILKSLSHPCVVKLYGINNPAFFMYERPLTTFIKDLHCTELPQCDLILSYCRGADLLQALTNRMGGLELWLVQRIFSELIFAVKYLHENMIIHRDIKLENILLNYPLDEIIAARDTPMFYSSSIIELGDFGLCKRVQRGELCTTRCGSEDYVSPEILMGVPYDGYLSDTWAVGVVLYCLLEDRLPFDPPPNAAMRQRNRPIAHRIARFDWRWFKMNLTGPEADPAKEIVKNTLTRRNQRWNASKIYHSPFVQEVASKVTYLTASR